MITHSRLACAIEVPDTDNIVITGEGGSLAGASRVVSYSVKGKATLLPSLQQPRRLHGCGYYYNNDQLVSCMLCIVLRLYFIHPDVLGNRWV